jgi:hypothetical protein
LKQANWQQTCTSRLQQNRHSKFHQKKGKASWHVIHEKEVGGRLQIGKYTTSASEVPTRFAWENLMPHASHSEDFLITALHYTAYSACSLESLLQVKKIESREAYNHLHRADDREQPTHYADTMQRPSGHDRRVVDAYVNEAREYDRGRHRCEKASKCEDGVELMPAVGSEKWKVRRWEGGKVGSEKWKV